MKIDIQSTDLELYKTTQDNIQRKLKLALNRMEPHITRVSVHISNVADSDCVFNKHCRLKITLAHMSNILIEDIQTDLSNVIDRVIEKASRALKRKLELDKDFNIRK